MKIVMAGIDYKNADINIREKVSFTELEIINICHDTYKDENIYGLVILSTCNRTEIYLSCSDNFNIPAENILLKYINDYSVKKYFYNLEDINAASHIIEVACGIHSKIIGEEQIVQQINYACELSRKNGFSDAILNTLFRIAVTAGKFALTNIKISNFPLSSAYSAIQLISNKIKILEGKKCVIIGNGKISKAAQKLLLEKKCNVFVTIRSYKHKDENNDTNIYKGCKAIDYKNRFSIIDGADFVISATKSPHFTITKKDIDNMKNKPNIIVDLAIPRDIEPCIYDIGNIECFNIDDLNIDEDINIENKISMLYDVSNKYLNNFINWKNYKISLKTISEIKEIIAKRIIKSNTSNFIENKSFDDIVKFTVSKTADIIIGSMKNTVTPKNINSSIKKIKERARI